MSKSPAAVPQFLIDAARKAHPGHNPNNFRVGYKFCCPTIHPQFTGTVGVIFIEGEAPNRTLHVWDYSLYVDVPAENNSFLMRLACGVMENLKWDNVDRVVLHIARPGGRARSWEIDAEDLCIWLEDVHIPSIERAAPAHAASPPAAMATPPIADRIAAASVGNVVSLAAYRRSEPRSPAQP